MAVIKPLLLTLVLISSSMAHPLKMTTGKIVINTEEKNLEVTINFFLDDFLDHLQLTYLMNIDSLGDSALEVIEEYVNQNFQIQINEGENQILTLTSAEIVSENVLQIGLKNMENSIEQINSVKISNTLLFDAFPKEQANILHVNIPSVKESKILRFSTLESQHHMVITN